MKFAIAVHFDGAQAQAAAVAFDAWDSPEAAKTYLSHIAHVEKPARGELDLRALPCVMQLLREHQLAPELILIDGFVHLDADETPGLGRHLFHALGSLTPVIGVAKTRPPGLSAQFEVMREEETPPLIVTCAGVDIGAAKARVRAMHGRKRVPTLLKLVARLAKGAG
ncbi:endonuclease V [Roseateles sp.]|jgi:deoxyribonuclease V|uniref:endonuclease V n=1 Tax=Roseateles sp. TaxID=1971397 RepID=UPI003BAC46C5